MNRRLAQLVAFLLVGAAINLTVAWGFAWGFAFVNDWGSAMPRARRVDGTVSQDGVISTHFRQLGRYRARQSKSAGEGSSPPDSADTDEFRRHLPWWSTLHDESPLLKQGIPEAQLTPLTFYYEVANGWPLLCFRGNYVMRVTLGAPHKLEFMNEQGVVTSVATEYWGVQGPAYPLIPIWPALVVNTLFYAAVAWICYALVARLVYVATTRARRRVRLRQRHCPRCAYPIGTSSVCTECGMPLPKKPASPDEPRP